MGPELVFGRLWEELGDKGRYRKVRENLYVKDVRLTKAEDTSYV